MTCSSPPQLHHSGLPHRLSLEKRETLTDTRAGRVNPAYLEYPQLAGLVGRSTARSRLKSQPQTFCLMLHSLERLLYGCKPIKFHHSIPNTDISFNNPTEELVNKTMSMGVVESIEDLSRKGLGERSDILHKRARRGEAEATVWDEMEM